MPYIITTTPQCPSCRAAARRAYVFFEGECFCGEVVYREAVATLEEGAALVHRLAGGESTGSDWSYDQCLCKFPADGGSITLPDGTRIAVEPISDARERQR